MFVISDNHNPTRIVSNEFLPRFRDITRARIFHTEEAAKSHLKAIRRNVVAFPTIMLQAKLVVSEVTLGPPEPKRVNNVFDLFTKQQVA